MVKPLTFKGDKKTKKRKRDLTSEADPSSSSKSQALTTTTTSDATTATADDAADDDTWVTADAPTDISGPIIIVLPSEPASILSCDAAGKVFSIPVENFVDGDAFTTAEPHDVRQVWVANRAAGMEGVSLKGAHGRYLSCDKFGILTSTSTAVSPLETFLIIPVPDNPSTFSLQTEQERFVTINDSNKPNPDIRGDASEITFNTTFRIRMQARFKPKLRVKKEERAREKISRKELEEMVGRRLEEDEVRTLKRARREGDFHERLLDLKVKGKHDKYG